MMGKSNDDRKIAKEEELEPGVRLKLAGYLDDYTIFSSMEREAQQSKRHSANGMLNELDTMELDAVDMGGMRLAKSRNHTSRIVREKLLERGVSPDIIAYATVETESEPFLRVSKLGEK